MTVRYRHEPNHLADHHTDPTSDEVRIMSECLSAFEELCAAKMQEAVSSTEQGRRVAENNVIRARARLAVALQQLLRPSINLPTASANDEPRWLDTVKLAFFVGLACGAVLGLVLASLAILNLKE